ncbi:hypothetical protein [Dokdonella sp.]|uniref:hypothetical protein n=1 Tax=Dokdonella sp. TaxID=2291710 RepID=UPI003C6FFA2A
MWIAALNSAMSVGFDAWLFLLGALPHWMQIGATATLVAFWLLFASHACGLPPTRIRSRVLGCLAIHSIGLVRYEQDPGAPQPSRWRQLHNTLRHFGLPLLPFFAMCLPVALVVVQIESHFGWRATHPDEPLIISASLPTDASVGMVISKRKLALELPAGLESGAPPLRLDDEATIVWRVSATAPGTYPIRLKLDDSETEVDVLVGETRAALSTQHRRPGDWRTLAFPAAKPLERGSAFQVVRIDYPRRADGLLGFTISTWLLLGLAFMFAFGFRSMLDKMA